MTTYAADSTAEDVIRERLDNPDGLGPLLVGTRPGHLDGYIAADELQRIVGILELRPDPDGKITLRSSGFEIVTIQQLALGHRLLRALDRASPLTTERAAADIALRSALGEFR